MATEEQEKRVKKIVIDSEYSKSLENKTFDTAEFEGILDMLECERTEKNADWRSDIFIPQFFSQIISQASGDANQYFQSRDFVETYIGSDRKAPAAQASERLINRTLNQRHLHHYQKYMRGRMLNYLNGEVVTRHWWEKDVQLVKEQQPDLRYSETRDIYGDPLLFEDQEPAVEEVMIEVMVPKVVKDRYNYDVLDPRNVFMDNTYVYSLQDKKWIILRSEVTLDDLEMEADQKEYFNLDKLKEVKTDAETETSKETYNKRNPKEKPKESPSKYFDRLERFGKFWVVVKERDGDGYPLVVEPGFDDLGERKKGAEYVECLITFAMNATMSVMIGFQPQRCRDVHGNAYRPLGRGLHFIHPTDDTGIGDGKAARELQIGMNDSVNIGNDRTLFATMPMMKRKKFGNEDQATLDYYPGATLDLDDVNSLQEVIISDNIQGTLGMAQFFKGMMELAMAQSPSTMGQLPEDSSTTATAIAGADARTNMRSNYKSLTFENTHLTEQYWMIQQLTWQYAEPETAEKLLGDKIMDFDPDGDYWYKPVSQSIETEYAKATKIKNLISMTGYIAQVDNPKTSQLVNRFASMVLENMGEEFDKFKGDLLDETVPVEGVTNVEEQGVSASNQSGVPQSQAEAVTREAVA